MDTQLAAVTADDAAASGDAYEHKMPLGTLVEWFEDAEEVTDSARRLSERDRDYYDNKQLTSAELAELKKRGQPDIIINRIQTKVNYLLGYEALQRTDPRAYPRNPADEDAAEACTDSLRFVADKAKFAQPFSAVWANMLVEGFGGVELRAVPKPNGDADIQLTHWHWDRLFYDPHSREHDFSDARYIGGVIWMDEEDARAKWTSEEAQEAIQRTCDSTLSTTYEDRPHWKKWASGARRKRIRIVQMWHREGLPGLPNYKWVWCIYTKGGKLETGVSPYVDEDGHSLCPMVLQSAFIDRENNRYGFVRALIGPQDEINKRRSKALHLLNVRQTMAEDGAVDDVDDMKSELARPDGHVVVNPGFRFEMLSNNDQITGQLQLLQEAKNEIDLLGPNASMQGKGERSASGRAIIANQQGGQIEISLLMDRHNHFKERVYRLAWAMIRQYWTAQKWIRVTDDERKARFVGLNKPVTVAEKVIERATQQGLSEEEAKKNLAAALEQDETGQVRAQLEQVAGVENVLAEMDMDIILEQVPDSANIQQEQFEILASLAQAGIQFPPKVYIEASALRDKRKLLELLEQGQDDPAAQAMGQAQLEKLAAELEQLKADIAKTKAETKKLEAEEIETLMKADEVDQQMGLINMPRIIPFNRPQSQPSQNPEFQGQFASAQGMPMAPANVDPDALSAAEPQQIDPMNPPLPEGPAF